MVHQGAPVVLIVSVTTAMYTPDAEGVVHPGPSDELTTRRHALLAVGSGHTEDQPYVAAHLYDTGLIQNTGWTA